eukprot:CAMPEP_0172089924 /NCGR_PEP_ID=MMETSP1043-20130122/24077_1 /TAXON_ID=464988 /ORGANISM="Hemiselmis andersenii, Strain CCMP441" /LENGTH=267 /DNA_ID=CAMNT_0012752429 /DNA_START=37 /DNA_END=839 /DNA_ORIENTATION=+
MPPLFISLSAHAAAMTAAPGLNDAILPLLGSCLGGLCAYSSLGAMSRLEGGAGDAVLLAGRLAGLLPHPEPPDAALDRLRFVLWGLWIHSSPLKDPLAPESSVRSRHGRPPPVKGRGARTQQFLVNVPGVDESLLSPALLTWILTPSLCSLSLSSRLSSHFSLNSSFSRSSWAFFSLSMTLFPAPATIAAPMSSCAPTMLAHTPIFPAVICLSLSGCRSLEDDDGLICVSVDPVRHYSADPPPRSSAHLSLLLLPWGTMCAHPLARR